MRNRSLPGWLPWTSARPSWSAACGCRVRVPRRDDCRRSRRIRRCPGSWVIWPTAWSSCGSSGWVMEATSAYWKPVFYLLEAHGLQPWLVNARDVRHPPGRPKTDVLDAVWLCKVAERQMLRPSFVPPRPIRQLRELTRYRIDPVGARTAEKNRVGEAARGRLHQAVSGGLGHLRCLRAADDGGVDRRGARPEGARRDGADPDACQDSAVGGGVHRPFR